MPNHVAGCVIVRAFALVVFLLQHVCAAAVPDLCAFGVDTSSSLVLAEPRSVGC